MRRWLIGGLLALAGLAALAAGAIAVLGPERSTHMVFSHTPPPAVDFAGLERGWRPNQYLLCPPGLCESAKADGEAPSFAEAPAALRARFRQMALAQPRVALVRSDDALMQDDYVQRSRLMGFPDTITVRFLPTADGGSTLAVYSRAHYGISDRGVNKARVTAWLAALD